MCESVCCLYDESVLMTRFFSGVGLVGRGGKEESFWPRCRVRIGFVGFVPSKLCLSLEGWVGNER